MELKLPKLIGITGLAGVGKDTLADHLVTLGYEKVSMAGPLKRLLNERFGWTDEMWADRVWKELPSPECGFDVRTEADYSPRSWAQWLGTEVGRYIGGPDVWVNMVMRQWAEKTAAAPQPYRMVIPDVRFDNEAMAIRQRGGVILHISRPGAAPVVKHASEAGISRNLIHRSIVNDMTIPEFLEGAMLELEIAYLDQKGMGV